VRRQPASPPPPNTNTCFKQASKLTDLANGHLRRETYCERVGFFFRHHHAFPSWHRVLPSSAPSHRPFGAFVSSPPPPFLLDYSLSQSLLECGMSINNLYTVREAAEISNAPSPDYCAEPLDSDLFEWHFTLRGPPNSAYAEGIYHGRIVLPPTYPLRPPSFRFMTPSGRFEANREICLSISGHHEETWQPAWGVRTALVAYVAIPIHLQDRSL
jgi:hypothetical protein